MNKRPQDPGAHEPESGQHAPPSSDGQAWSIMSYILSGLLIWGGAGWLLDRWLGTTFLLLIGLLVGASASLYLVWLRYGRP
jgi:ATP synthase protein I